MARHVRGTTRKNRSVGALRSGGDGVYKYNNTPYAFDPAYMEPDIRPTPKPDIHKPKRKPDQGKRTRRRVEPLYEHESRPWLKVSFSAIITLLIFFACAGAFLVSYALCSVHTYDGQQLRVELQDVTESNLAIAASQAQNFDLERIRELAKNKLHMVEPGEHQKVYIEVPDDNYFIQY